MLDRFLSLAGAKPDATALIDAATGEVLTRSALLALAREIGAACTAAGVRPRDLVAVQLRNSPEFVASFIAALELGFVLVPIDRDATASEVATILSHFGVRALVYADGASPRVSISTRPVATPPVLPADAVLVKLSSGSTGQPKGIVGSAATLAADADQICRTMDIRPDDVNLGAIPFSHSYGFSNLVTPLLLQGTAIVIANDYIPQSIVATANRHACTVVPGIPMMFDHLASLTPGDGEFPTVRTFLSAAAPLPPSTSRRFRERFGRPIHTFYGCSECGGITYDRTGNAVERGTVGTAMERVDLSRDRSHRMRIRGANVSLGYLHDARTFVPFEDGEFVADDLVDFRADGEIVLTGRASDLINTAGKKVNPREVEQVILQIDGIRQVKVYGEPAGARGEVVAAAILADPDVTRETIRAECRARLSSHKVPRIVKFIERIPVDERGKVKRAILAQL